ncbi:hypothetical protein [Streptomyces europaeiscabiei]|uniref:hypothetical protein n=1 Tax=Streptomyces europaeiscabiei TaxID=146819 RepID=UPI002E12F8F2|nr:hypothetical protein OHB30_10790 [Streptomyces europaeiscabiei]
MNGFNRAGAHAWHGGPPNNSAYAGAYGVGRNPRNAENSAARHQRQPSPSGTHAAANSALLNSDRQSDGIAASLVEDGRGNPVPEACKAARTFRATLAGVSPFRASDATRASCRP